MIHFPWQNFEELFLQNYLKMRKVAPIEWCASKVCPNFTSASNNTNRAYFGSEAFGTLFRS